MRKRRSGSRLPLRRRETRALPILVLHHLWSETRTHLKRLRLQTPNPALKRLGRPRMSSWKTEIHRPSPSLLLLRSAQNILPHVSLSHLPLTLFVYFRALGSPR